MRPLPAPRVIPDSPRYWSVDLAGKGMHHFRYPVISVRMGLMAIIGELAPHLDGARGDVEAGIKPNLADASVLAEKGAPILGACWFHRGLEFEARYPSPVTPEGLADYGMEIQNELADQGYTDNQTMSLIWMAIGEIIRRGQAVREAKETADFFVPPADGSPASKPS